MLGCDTIDSPASLSTVYHVRDNFYQSEVPRLSADNFHCFPSLQFNHPHIPSSSSSRPAMFKLSSSSSSSPAACNIKFLPLSILQNEADFLSTSALRRAKPKYASSSKSTLTKQAKEGKGPAHCLIANWPKGEFPWDWGDENESIFFADDEIHGKMAMYFFILLPFYKV